MKNEKSESNQTRGVTMMTIGEIKTRELIDWADESREGWHFGVLESDNPKVRKIEGYDRVNLTLGCLMRIAYALETLAGVPEGKA